jgi:hypothetical protein
MKKENSFDFGFSLVDEDELKALERELATKVVLATESSAEYKDKFETLYEMVMILLRNLSKEPTKSYIFWPNRIEKVNEFITRINELAEKKSTTDK